MFFIRKQTGVTLIELTVVLIMLVALAGVAVPYISGTGSTALCNATDVTMQNIKKVIMERYYLDTLGYFPKNTKAGNDYSLKYLFTKPNEWNLFNPETQTGWRGNYLQGGITLTKDQYYSIVNLNGSFKDATATTPHVNTNPIDADTGINGDIVVLDGWGRPIIIQVDIANNIAKLVSAGSGTGSGIGEAIIETPVTTATPANGYRAANSDDRILYLNAPTPAADVNPPCDQN